MREIKFRGKRVDNGGWVYGFYYWNDCDNQPYIMVDFHEHHQVKIETLGQLIGVPDKEGGKIYEDDIILTDGGFKAVIEFGDYYDSDGGGDSDQYGYFLCEKPSQYTSSVSEINLFGLVIGNIHDNPEILK